jgi:hypothetical protein
MGNPDVQLIEGAYGKGEAERFVNNAGITIYGSGPQIAIPAIDMIYVVWPIVM